MHVNLQLKELRSHTILTEAVLKLNRKKKYVHKFSIYKTLTMHKCMQI